jgi:cobyrinic acid a,c-diamide synthase
MEAGLMQGRTLPAGLVIAAPRSGSGKTTLTLGLLRALRRAGVTVGSAKCGPDYIDPAFHARASGRPGVNLDSWAMPTDMIAALAASFSQGCDVVICEGLMGLFDGIPATAGGSGSTADIAAALGWPVLLVLDASGQSQSAAAVARGFASHDPRITVAGVVLNRIGSARHAGLTTDAVQATGIPVVGALPRSDGITLPERHLGLVQAGEAHALDGQLDRIADFVQAHVDIARIRALARPGHPPNPDRTHLPALPPPGQLIALAQDVAFSFIYPHVLDGWRRAGAEIRCFSPLADEAPDDACDACWLPGGYPELHAGRLANADRFMAGLRRFAATRPVHGECGGYMVLGEALIDADGTRHAMAGLLDVTTSFARRKLHLGYRVLELLEDGCIGRAGSRLRGHEFHYSSVEHQGRDSPFALAGDAYGSATPSPTGSRRGRVSGSYLHVIATAA